MEPIRIKVKNFKSYAEEEISLQEFSLACVSGPNGAGKSTLFTDALLFALFGTSQTGSIDDLVRKGEQDMTVEVEFCLNGQDYRIVRSRSLKGKGKSILELHARDGEGWKQLTGDNIRDTEKKVEDLLRINQETFTSSSLILQGRSNEFTAKGPADRKKILSQILGLEIYDKLQQLAKDRGKAVKFEIDGVQEKLASISSQLDRKGEIQSLIEGCQGRLSEADASIQRAKTDIAEVEEQIRQLKTQADKAEDIRREQKAIDADIAALESQKAGILQKAERAKKIAGNKEAILAKAKEYEETKAQVAELDRQQQAWWAGKADVDAKAQAVTQAMRAHENRVNALQREIGVLENKHQQTIQATQLQLDNAKKRAALLDEVGCDRGDCKFLKDAFEAKKDIPGLEKDLAGLRQTDPAQMLRPELELLQSTEPAKAEKEALEKAKQAFAGIRYDQAVHQELKAKLPDLEKWARLVPELKVAEEFIQEAEKQLQALDAQLIEKRDRSMDLMLARDALGEIEPKMAQYNRYLTSLQNDLARFENQKSEILQAFGRAQQQLVDIEALEKEKEPLQAKLEALAADLAAYQTLQKAFSRDGIPALIIENAIPELERMANDILERMTHGAMNLSFRTQKETKTAGISETLDIVVRDWQGERVYESFSGGEKFRIDFAIRLALGELLAKRAGAKIEMIVIDEPDGLDADGMDMFAQVLGVMSERFKKTIAISHQERLKEAFPTRIEVYKTDQGSKVMVN